MLVDFRPTYTPQGHRVAATFEIKGRVFVVDEWGDIFSIITDDDDPDKWTWQFTNCLPIYNI